jgi:hypothetical protein
LSGDELSARLEIARHAIFERFTQLTRGKIAGHGDRHGKNAEEKREPSTVNAQPHVDLG